MTFGQKVKAQRLDNGWTQQELAQRLGVNRSSVGYYENDQTQPRTHSDRQKLAEVLGVSYSYLFRDDEELGLDQTPSIDMVALRKVLTADCRDGRKDDLKMWVTVLKRLCQSQALTSDVERRGLEACIQRAEAMLEKMAVEGATREGGTAGAGPKANSGTKTTKCLGGGATFRRNSI